MSIGSFHSPWFSYGIASIYNICDKIVVSNVGYDMKNPDDNKLVALESVTQEIVRLDIRNKIIELRNLRPEKLNTKMHLMTQKQANDTKQSYGSAWFDVRGLGLTAANERAVSEGGNWILKIDSDQACYSDIRKLKTFLHVFPSNGLKFRQFEFSGDVGGEYNFLSDPPPADYEDSIFVYKALNGQYYGGGGAPALYLPGEDRLNTNVFHCAHLRSANPVWLSDTEKFNHFYGRSWFKNYTNTTGKFNSKLEEMSRAEAYRNLEYPNKRVTDIKPPEVCLYKDPLEYIRAGY